MKSKRIKEGVEFVNSCGCFVDLDLLKSALVWYTGGVCFRKRKIYLNGGYPTITVEGGKKFRIHRLLALHRLMIQDAPGTHAHHIDGNKLNASIDNIELLTDSEHTFRHKKGVPFTTRQKELISLANRKRKGKRLKRRVLIPVEDIKELLESGKSIYAISKIYCCCHDTIKRILKESEQ